MPILVLSAWPLCVEDAERTAKIPQSPSRMHAANYVQGVIKPGIDDIGGRIFIAAHFPKMNRNPMLRELSPGTEFLFKSLLVGNDSALRIP